MKRLFLSIFTCVAVVGQITNINIGTSANDKSGDTLRTAFSKVNTNVAWLSGQLLAATNSPNFTTNATVAGADVATKVANIAALVALSPKQDGQLVQTLGYRVAGDGGGLTFYWSESSNATTNLGTVFQRSSGGSGRFLWVADGVMPVEAWGAVGDWNSGTLSGTDNYNAISSMLSWINSASKNSTVPTVVLFNSGDYASSAGFTISRNGISIVGQAPNNAAVTRSTSIVITGTNTPAITFNGYDQSLRNIGIKYAYRQPSTATESKAIVFGSGAFKSLIDNVSVKYGSYGVYCNSSSVSQVRINKLWIQNYSISGYAALQQGTTWTLSDIYVQNLDPDDTSQTHSTITGVSLSSGTNITFTCSGGLPPLLTTNRLFSVSGMDSSYNAGYFALTISGNSVTCSSTTPLSAPVITSGGTLSFVARPSTGVPFISGYGNVSITGLDIEHVVTDGDCAAQFGSSQANQINDIYLEHVYRSSGSLAFVKNVYGPLTIDSLNVVNCGVNQFQTNWFVANTFDATAAINVQHISARDVGKNSSASLYVGRTDSPASFAPRVSTIGTSPTVRANASGDFDRLGSAQFNFAWSPDLRAASGTETVASVAYNISQSGSAGYYGVRLIATNTATGSGVKYPFAFTRGGIDYFRFNDSGITEIGDPAGVSGTVMTLYGNVGGTPVLRLVRPGSADYGVNLSSGVGFYNFSVAQVSLTSFVDSSSVILRIGSSGNSSPKTSQLYAESATGSNVGGATLVVNSGTGTGTGAASIIQLRTPTLGTSGATAQTMTERVRIDSTVDSTLLPIWINYNGTLKQVQVGAADSGGVGYRLLRITN